MKYFIRKRKDCISSLSSCVLAGGEKKMEAGHKEKRFFWNLLRAYVCDEWRGSVRIGC